jgi:hypothetical protein
VLALLLLSVGWVGLNGTTWASLVASDLDNVDRALERAVSIYRDVPPLSAEQSAALRRSRNAAHVAAAQRVGTAPVSARADLEDAAADRGLVQLESDSIRAVHAGRYSLPFLTPRAEQAVDSIAVRFRRRLVAAGLPAFRITISSVWRSSEDQAALAQVNVNAALGRSSHEYATTFDIPYRRYAYAGPGGMVLPTPSERLPQFLRAYVREETARRAEHRFDHLAETEPTALDAALGRTLITLENDGVLLVIREVRQPVYHGTSAR